MPLPASLSVAIATQLALHKPADLAAATAQTTARYRGGSASQRAIPDELAVAAYLAARLPATYAAIEDVLERLAAAMPDFAPTSLLDIGAGPGTASFAACEAFDGLSVIRMLDAHTGFRAMSRTLARSGDHPALQSARIEPANIVSEALGAADLVIAAYALVELTHAQVAPTALRLFAAATVALVLIEPGTPEGWRRLMLARGAIIATGGHILAPCPHAKACPLIGNDWCHFSIRVQRSKAHKSAKAADVPFEDEKYIYLIASPNHIETMPTTRIIAQPHVTKPGIRMKICNADGVHDTLVPARDRLATRRSRHLRWGDVLVETSDAETAGLPAAGDG